MVSCRIRSRIPALLAGLAAIQSAASADFSTEWSRCITTISDRHYAGTANRLKLNLLFAQYADRASNASSRAEFARIVNEMIGKIGDSHFGLYTSETQTYYVLDGLLRNARSPQPFTGAFFTEQAGGWKVAMVFNGSSAEKAGLRKDDLVTQVNGQPFSPIVALKRVDGIAHLDVLRNGKSMKIDLAVTLADFTTKAAESTRSSCRIIASKGKKYGYLKLWMMLGDSFLMSLIDSVTGTLKDTDAMILDLRDGFGGYTDWYPDVFFRPDFVTERKDQTGVKQVRYGYSKPVVLLINGGTRSAKEVFSCLMKSTKRGTLIGSRTACKVLGCQEFRIADWAILQVPVVDLLIDGKRLEGTGVEPDIEVKPEYGPNGEDLILNEALRFLDKQN